MGIWTDAKILLGVFVLLLLVSCGGGSGSSAGPSSSSGTSTSVSSGTELSSSSSSALPPPVSKATISATDAYFKQQISLDGSTSQGTGTLKFLWEQTGGNSVTITQSNQSKAGFVVPNVSTDTTLIFRLTVTDDSNKSSASDVSITVHPQVAALAITLSNKGKFFVDDESMKLSLTINNNPDGLVPVSVKWTSNLQGDIGTGISSIQPNLKVGTHTITVTANFDTKGFAQQDVVLPVLPRMSPITAFQQTPPTNAVKTIPIVLVSFIPTTDGINVTSPGETEPEWSARTVEDLQSYLSRITTRSLFMLSEGSKFRGYSNPSAVPYIGYKVVAHYNYYQLMKQTTPTSGKADLFDVMTKINAKDWVETHGVNEVWIWGHPFAGLNESNMSSALTGDQSNSDRIANDLPIYNRSYVVYGYNYGRSHNEAVHDHGHQLEAMFSYIDIKENGNDNFFWKEFASLTRCGNTHFALNSTDDYDYANFDNIAKSDCKTWKPGGGTIEQVTAHVWDSTTLNWPSEAYKDSNEIPSQTESKWYVFWMQSMPGYQNKIAYTAKSTTMENWWVFVADWDAANKANLKLHK